MGDFCDFLASGVISNLKKKKHQIGLVTSRLSDERCIEYVIAILDVNKPCPLARSLHNQHEFSGEVGGIPVSTDVACEFQYSTFV